MAELKDYSTTAGSNNSASPNGMPENMAPSGVNDAWREGTARLRRWYADISATITTAGTGNTYTFAASRAVSAYAAGDVYLVVADKTNTGAATFNVDGVGAKDLVSVQLAALVAGQVVANGVYWIAYDAINDKFILLNHHTVVTPYAEINTLSTLTALAEDDLLDFWDTSGTARKSITIENARKAIAGNFDTLWASTSLTLNDWTIPSWARRITIIFSGVSLSSTGDLLVQLGDGGGIETSGYVSTESRVNGSGTAMATSTAGFLTTLSNSSRTLSGVMTLDLIDSGSGLWVAAWNTQNSIPEAHTGAGNKTVSAAPATTLRVTNSAAGANSFSAGSVNVFFE